MRYCSIPHLIWPLTAGSCFVISRYLAYSHIKLGRGIIGAVAVVCNLKTSVGHGRRQCRGTESPGRCWRARWRAAGCRQSWTSWWWWVGHRKPRSESQAWSTGRTTCRCGSSWIRGGAASRSFRKTKSIPSIHQWVEAIRNKVNNNELNWFDHWLLLLQRLTFASYRRADGGGNYKNSLEVQQEWKWD